MQSEINIPSKDDWKQEIASEIGKLVAEHKEALCMLQSSVNIWLNAEDPKKLLPLRFDSDYNEDEQLTLLAALHDTHITTDNRIISLDSSIDQMHEAKTKKQYISSKKDYGCFVRWEALKSDTKALLDVCIGDYNYDENCEPPNRATSQDKKTKKEKEKAQREDYVRLCGYYQTPKDHKAGAEDVRSDLEFEKFLSTFRGKISHIETATHSDDFISVIWYGHEYTFTKTQALCVKILWENWEKRCPSISEKTIAEEIDSSDERFRLYNTFNRGKHPAWGTMIVPMGKGIFGLEKPKK